VHNVQASIAPAEVRRIPVTVPDHGGLGQRMQLLPGRRADVVQPLIRGVRVEVTFTVIRGRPQFSSHVPTNPRRRRRQPAHCPNLGRGADQLSQRLCKAGRRIGLWRQQFPAMHQLLSANAELPKP
jgi:hypothetical protein